MDIAEVAQRSGVPASALRFYEEKGLIRSTGRKGLRRYFDAGVLERLALLALGRVAGFSLDEIARMFAPDGRPRIDRKMLAAKADELEETIRKLRIKVQPIRLFGESDRERRLRLRALELIEERDQERQGGQNDFKKALEDVENVEKLMNKNVDDSSSSGKRRDETKDSVDILDLDLLKTDPQKVYPIIYYALKRRLKEWEEWMDQRPGTFHTRLCLSTGN